MLKINIESLLLKTNGFFLLLNIYKKWTSLVVVLSPFDTIEVGVHDQYRTLHEVNKI